MAERMTRTEKDVEEKAENIGMKTQRNNHIYVDLWDVECHNWIYEIGVRNYVHYSLIY